MNKLPLKFRPAQRHACKASIMIEGLPGSGKSGLALSIAYVLSENKWDKIFAVDTENQSLDLFDHKKMHTGQTATGFNKVDLTEGEGFRPTYYKALTEGAVTAGGSVMILDSISHMWMGQDGVMSLVDQVKAANPKMDNYRVWGVPEVAKEKSTLIHVIRNSKIHVISTVRVKEKFDMVYDPVTQKNKVQSMGEQQMQQSDLKYEPDLVIHMLRPGSPNGQAPVGRIIKSRYDIFEQDREYEFTDSLLEQLKQYLLEGVDVEALLQRQHDDYQTAISAYIGENKARASIWTQLKKDRGFDKTKLGEIPLDSLREMYQQLTI